MVGRDGNLGALVCRSQVLVGRPLARFCFRKPGRSGEGWRGRSLLVVVIVCVRDPHQHNYEEYEEYPLSVPAAHPTYAPAVDPMVYCHWLS
jgi:hypothetical protein